MIYSGMVATTSGFQGNDSGSGRGIYCSELVMEQTLVPFVHHCLTVTLSKLLNFSNPQGKFCKNSYSDTYSLCEYK